jgi:hypothetical protein
MLFEKFLNLIDRTPVGTTINKRIDIIEKTDPDRIYVENIRSFYNLPYFAAKALCEIATKEHIFKKKFGLICPNNDCRRIIHSYELNEKPDNTITCTQCLLDEHENSTFDTSTLEIIEFYQLQD